MRTRGAARADGCLTFEADKAAQVGLIRAERVNCPRARPDRRASAVRAQEAKAAMKPVSYTHLTLPTTPYV